MSLWKIAWRSIQRRGVASTLTSLSMALGVMLVVLVLTIHGVVSQSFRNNSTLGYNMIIGAKGGKLQLTLNTVYYLSQPVENIPYDFYMEFLPADQRRRQLENSLVFAAHKAGWQAGAAVALAAGAITPSAPATLSLLAASEAVRAADLDRFGANRAGRFAPMCDLVIPVCLGDFYGPFRVVGTTPALLDKLHYDLENDRKYEFAQGRNFRHYDPEHGYFEAVVGARVARQLNIHVGDTIWPTHGEPGGHTHEQQFTVVGILKPSGTPNDRAVLVNMEGFYLMADHAKPLPAGEPPGAPPAADEGHEHGAELHWEEDYPQQEKARGHAPGHDHPQKTDAAHHDDRDAGAGEHAGDDDHEESPHDDHTQPAEHEHPSAHEHDHGHGPQRPLPLEQREVTALLVRTVSPLVTPGMQNMINEGPVAQAVLPIQEIYSLFQIIVRPIQAALLLLTAMICVVSGVSILVSIYNSMSDRRHEIAVMRALGAGRTTVMTVILLESIMLSVGGGLVGWVLAHLLSALGSPLVEARTGVAIGFFDFAPPINLLGAINPDWQFLVQPELVLIPALMLLAVMVGFWPALAAYRTDVAKALGK